MEENIAQMILEQITAMSSQINTLQENMTNMEAKIEGQIADLSIGQVKLSEKIDRVEENLRKEFKTEIAKVREELGEKIEEVRTELKAEIAEVRAELKAEIAEVRAELKAEIAEVRAELKAEIAEVKTELKEEIAEVREIAEFTKETCETIMNVIDKEYKISKSRIKVLDIATVENKKYIVDHEKRICLLETKRHNIPLV